MAFILLTYLAEMITASRQPSNTDVGDSRMTLAQMVGALVPCNDQIQVLLKDWVIDTREDLCQPFQ